MSNLEYWIWFSSLYRLSFRTRRALLERYGTAKEIFFAEPRELKRIDGITAEELDALSGHDLSDAAKTVRRCGELDVRIITIQDAVYPERLRNIPDPPSVLYVKGRLPAVDAEAVVAVVGTRKSTPYGDKLARSIAYEIVSKGGIICTGLAGGIDSRAAEGALMAGGPVIGVLGVAINHVYPSGNARLYEDVQATGALVSEYPPDANGSAAWFPRRNRIMAGLSVGAVVVEAPLRSGALITARRALDYGRDVFAVPGNTDAPNSRGCNQLLREGASIAENGWDVLREYEVRFPGRIMKEGKGEIPEELAVPEENRAAERREKEPPEIQKGKGFFKFRVRARKPAGESVPEERNSLLEEQLKDLSEDQLKIIGAMEKKHMHVDDIVDLSRLPAATVLSELTMLQIKGVVSQEPGKRFTLNIQSK